MTRTKPSVLVRTSYTHASIELALWKSALLGAVESVPLLTLYEAKRNQLERKIRDFDLIFILESHHIQTPNFLKYYLALSV